MNHFSARTTNSTLPALPSPLPPPPKVPGFQGTDSTPALSSSGDRIVVGSYDGNVYCLDSTNGKELWKASFDFGVGEGTPALVESLQCFVVAGYGKAECLDAETGKARWTFAPKKSPSSFSSSQIASCGAVDQERGLVFVGTLDKQIWGVNTTDGSVVWRYDADGEICESDWRGAGALYVHAILIPPLATCNRGDARTAACRARPRLLGRRRRSLRER